MEDKKRASGPELCDQITTEIDLALADNQMVLRGIGIVVKEIPRKLEPSGEHDPFIDDLSVNPDQGELFQ